MLFLLVYQLSYFVFLPLYTLILNHQPFRYSNLFFDFCLIAVHYLFGNLIIHPHIQQAIIPTVFLPQPFLNLSLILYGASLLHCLGSFQQNLFVSPDYCSIVIKNGIVKGYSNETT